MKYTNWQEGQPSNENKESCVEVNVGNTKRKWNDADCRKKRRSVCELDRGRYLLARILI